MIVPQWPAPKNVKALATERFSSSSSTKPAPLTGISLPPYDGLNLGDHVGDDPARVLANRQGLLDYAQGCQAIRWLQQVHGIYCPEASNIEDGAAADASFTQQSGLACAIMTADCLPVLFCDLQGRQVAAAHAGWKGLAAGVLVNTVDSFLLQGIAANQIIAWLGPAISVAAFEVGGEVKQAFSHFENGDTWADNTCFIKGRADRWQANLYQLARLQLMHLGLQGVYMNDENKPFCTYLDSNKDNQARFYSYRRQAITGRQASLIWLAE